MAPAPKEVDVFSGPHSRMKELVRIYSDKLPVTDFSNYSDLRELLWSLRSTFREFKTHEHIENECIMQKLKHRLDFLKVENQAVYKCHSDNRLSEMQGLLEDGCHQTEKCQSPSEMRTIGSKISEALEVFTKDFLPHMQEEEELFQPLLMQYFTYDELRRIRYDVIEKHTLHTKYCSDGDKEYVEDETLAEKVDGVKDEEDDAAAPCKISGLPTEVMLQIFTYLNPKELCHAAQVNTQWNQISMDGALWKGIYPVRWAQGDWRFTFEEDDLQDINPDCEDIYVTVDEDADFDESEASAESDNNNNSNTPDISQSVLSIRREAKMLDGIAKYLIPVVGHSVETLELSQSKGLNNAVVYRLLANTPNLKHLDLSLTKVSDIAFKGFGKNGSGKQLKHLNLSGCTSITDDTIKRLANAIRPHQKTQAPKRESTERTKNKSCSNRCCGVDFLDELSIDKNGRPKSQRRKERMDSSGHEVHASHTSQVTRHGSCSCSTRDNTPTTAECGYLNQRNKVCRINATIGTRTNGSLSDNRQGCKTSCSNTPKDNCEDDDDDDDDDEDIIQTSMLEFLSLAGCYKITDEGLGSLVDIGGLPNLIHLDLSGCLNVTSSGLNQLAPSCHQLDHEEFFYCDNILEGPYADTASGCQNLQCGHLVCCRSGH